MKKLLLSFTLISGISFSGSAQNTINDFNFYDTDSVMHSLYGYLNSNKTVCLWFFQWNGAQSIADAPFMQQFYLDFGSNTGNYIVLGSHGAQPYSNDTLNTWRTDNGVTFPVLGGDGAPFSGNGYLVANYYQAHWGTLHFTSGLGLPALGIICHEGGPPWNTNDIVYEEITTSINYNDAHDPMQCWPIGTNSSKYEKGVLMFPNPATDQLSFMINKPKATVEIYNVLGELIASDVHSGASLLRMDISDLPGGHYVVKVQTEEYTRTLKLEVAK